jgi:hypothetical protein
MSTKKSEIKIEYRIIAIRDSPVDAGKTEIMLRPTETELESGIENEPVMMMNGGMEALPPGVNYPSLTEGACNQVEAKHAMQ